ncbi:MAG: alkaline phosphatase family protein [Bacteroidaceae bacterium]|nr:alkaline phosphatase family protein [Bacteroidaceae bacterium]
MKHLRPISFIILLATSLFHPAKAQTTAATSPQPAVTQATPRLVVGLVVDQMRWDYLYRYADRYGQGGFKRLLREGFSAANCQINYMPTVTAAGHASVYTGTTPSVHGIAGNKFRNGNRWQYCTEDTTVSAVGSQGAAGRMSPRNMLATTMGDELKLATNFRSRVIGVALKDRAAILPAGHLADAAYWFDDEAGCFITSSFYRQELPQWAAAFNAQKWPDRLLTEKWQTLYPIETYTQSTADDAPYEEPFVDYGRTTFPYDLQALRDSLGYGLLRAVPQGIQLTFAMARAALIGEGLGHGSQTDMLCVSISPTDYIGHQFGINSIEVEDAYLRLDKELEAFLNFLDREVGQGAYLFFLTADHGAAHNIDFNRDHRIPSEPWHMSATTRELNDWLKAHYHADENLLFGDRNCQIHLAHETIARLGIDEAELRRLAVDHLKTDLRFAYVADIDDIAASPIPQLIRERAINGYHRERSGCLLTIPRPAIYGDSRTTGLTGSMHGVWNPYDNHIPCVFFGQGISHGETAREVHITDIAPTVCALLHIQMPNGCIGQPIEGVVK